jgi:hypothetical protein
MTILDEIQTSIGQYAAGAGSSVVGIGQRWGVGSGIVLAEGRVLTNAHNVRGDQVTVTFADGRTAEGSVAGQDLDGDLAVIEVDTGGAPALAWAAASPAASSTPRRCCPALPAARSSTPRGGCSASTQTASARAFTWPYPPTRRYGPGPTHSPAASQRRHRSLASPSPPVA